MKKLTEDESGEAMLWSLAYGATYLLLLNKLPDIEYHGTPSAMVAPGLQAKGIDAAARAHADQILETLRKKADSVKKARAKT